MEHCSIDKQENSLLAFSFSALILVIETIAWLSQEKRNVKEKQIFSKFTHN